MVCRSDCGSEFRASFDRMLRINGIEQTRSEPYTPQLNGKIEAAWKIFDNGVKDRKTGVLDYSKFDLSVDSYNTAHRHYALKAYNALGMYSPADVMKGVQKWKKGDPYVLVDRFDLQMDDE